MTAARHAPTAHRDLADRLGEVRGRLAAVLTGDAEPMLLWPSSIDALGGALRTLDDVIRTEAGVRSCPHCDRWVPQYEPWRHGGWYVVNLRYPSGAVGCVSRAYPDRRWRIVCDERPGDHTYPSRDAAARAERALVEAMAEVTSAPTRPVEGRD